jgi:hypothetical protein
MGARPAESHTVGLGLAGTLLTNGGTPRWGRVAGRSVPGFPAPTSADTSGASDTPCRVPDCSPREMG